MSQKLPDKMNEIKKLILKSLFADDDLMEIFVLKGGNALDIAYKIHSRSSIDMDVSMKNDFEDYNLTIEDVKEKIQMAFDRVFDMSEYKPYEFKIEIKPKHRKKGSNQTWGGYELLFKVVQKTNYIENDIEKTRRYSIAGGKKNSSLFSVDISKHEYTESKKEIEFEDMTIFVYTPLMIVNEKLRAICQQMDEYTVSSKGEQRARDFFDIYMVLSVMPDLEKEFYSEENKIILKEIFQVKEVPLALLNNIKNTYEFNEKGYLVLKDTIDVKIKIQDFKFYFNFVVSLIEKLESFWIK